MFSVFGLSRLQNFIKCSRADGRAKERKFSDVSGTDPSRSSGCCWRLITVLVLPCREQHPEDGERVSHWIIWHISHLNAAVCPRTFYWLIGFLLKQSTILFIVVPCMLFQSLLYCSNSWTTLHFKILKSHTKTLKIRPYMFRSPLKPSLGGPRPYFVRLLNWNVDLHLL